MPPTTAPPPGKDAHLDQTIALCQRQLLAMGLETEAVSWRNPAPHCWSLHLRCRQSPLLCSNGKGATRNAALASALGEFCERLATNFFFADMFLDEDLDQPFLFYPQEKWFENTGKSVKKKAADGSPLLNRELWRFYDPRGELTLHQLRDLNTDVTRPGIAALPFVNLKTGKQVYFPVSLLNTLYVSNGMAAGNSPAEAGAQALAEICERHAKNLIIANGISLPDVPAEHLRRHPAILHTLSRLEAAGYRVRVKDASLGGRFPVICALLTDPDSGGVFAAFGASLRFAVAVERTLSELLQGRTLSALKSFHEPEHDLALVADPFNLESHFIDSDGLLAWSMFRDRPDHPFTPWDFTGPTGQEFARLLDIVTASGATAYRAEYRHCGIYTCRIIVPGISEIYPLDDLFYGNRAGGAMLRRRLLELPTLDQDGLHLVLDELEELGLGEERLIGEVIGVSFASDSPWHELRLGELKAMLHLALGQTEDALLWCRWVVDHASLPAARHRLYRLLVALLGFRLAGQSSADFRHALSLRHGDGDIAMAEDALAGTIRFPGLPFARRWSELSAEHRRLLELYRHLNRFKIGQPHQAPPSATI